MSTMGKLLRGSAARTLETAVGILAGFITLPIMMRYLGADLYGLWILIGGFVASLYLFDFGFASSVSRYVARAIAQQDHDQANRVINSALVIYCLLGLLVMLFTLAIAWMAPSLMEDHSQVGLVRLLILLAGLTIAIEFPFKAFAGIAEAFLRHDLVAASRIIVKILSTTALILALLGGYKLLAVALIALATSVLSNCAFLTIAWRVYPRIRISRRLASRALMKELGGYSAWAFAIDVSRILRQRADIFVISAMLGTAPLALYYVAVRLTDFAVTFLNRATNLITPVFVEQLANRRHEDARETLILILRINFMTGYLCLACFLVAGDYLVHLWMGAELDHKAVYAVLIPLLLGHLIVFMTNPFQSVLLANATHQVLAIMTMIETFAALLLMIALVKWFDGGLVGVAVAAMIPRLVTRLLILPLLVHRVLPLSPLRTIGAITGPTLFFGVALGCGLALDRWLAQPDWVAFLAVGGLTALIFGLLNLLFLTEREKGYVLRLLGQRQNKPA